MAKLINLLFSVATGMLVLSVTVKAAAPETVSYTLPPEPHPGFYKVLDQCLTKITEICGTEIYLGLYKDHGKITNGCCNQLVDMGIRCHQTILFTSLQFLDKDEKAKTDVVKVLNNSFLVWSNCVDVSMPADYEESPTPSPAYVF